MPEAQSLLDRHYFLIRRLHSLSGVVPIGVFLFPHLTTNSSIIWGRLLNDAKHGDAGVETFQHEVEFIHNLPALKIIEWTVLFIPILFHSLVGIWFATSGRPNVDRYKYQDNWRYTLQRVSGYIGVLFIFMHIISLRFGFNLRRADAGVRSVCGLIVTRDPLPAGRDRGGARRALPGVRPLARLPLRQRPVDRGDHVGADRQCARTATVGLCLCSDRCRAFGRGGVAAVAGFSTLDIEQAQAVEAAIVHVGE